MAPRGLNNVPILGNGGRDPVRRYTAGGNAVTSFSVARGRVRRHPDSAETAAQPAWFRVGAGATLAATWTPLLPQGRKAAGSPQTRNRPAANDPAQQTVEVVGEEMRRDPRRDATGNTAVVPPRDREPAPSLSRRVGGQQRSGYPTAPQE